MFKKQWLFFIPLILAAAVCRAENKINPESDQQISDFSLSGFGERGKKSWDLNGKSADIFTDTVRLKDIVGNMYGEKENIKLTANKGDFDKKDGKMHLEENVVITTSSGAKLTTNSLDWDRKNNLVQTKDPVNIERQNMMTQALGATGHTDLKQVTLEKNVQVNIKPVDENKPRGDINKNKITITCDGPLEIDYDKNVAKFSNNVKVDREDSQIYSDTMEVYFSPGKEKNQGEANKEAGVMTSSIEKIVSKGNVKIVRGENVSYSEEAVYTASDRKITLLGKPRLIIYSAEDMNASSGN
ncbi:MAG: LPS export ABC transporter periplasmic protein LptC [Deltaproteobacteria bacterium]